MLGQQMHMGKRMQKSLNRGKRTLPHYPIDEIGLEQEFESQGFVKHSFLYGLNPQEFIFHSMSGREGISDTALKTANSGYVTRKMAKILEDTTIKYDGTIRANNDNIIQWSYGGDNFDRHEMAFKNGNVSFVDVDMVSSRLNNEYELRCRC